MYIGCFSVGSLVLFVLFVALCGEFGAFDPVFGAVLDAVDTTVVVLAHE